MGFEVPVWPRSTIYCIFIVWMLSIREEERDTKGELSWACLQGDLAQAAVGRDSHHLTIRKPDPKHVDSPVTEGHH